MALSHHIFVVGWSSAFFRIFLFVASKKQNKNCVVGSFCFISYVAFEFKFWHGCIQNRCQNEKKKPKEIKREIFFFLIFLKYLFIFKHKNNILLEIMF